MKCNKCNQEIPDNSKFCLHCGAQVEILDGIVCTCGYKNPLDARFCTECGKQIRSIEPLIKVVYITPQKAQKIGNIINALYSPITTVISQLITK